MHVDYFADEETRVYVDGDIMFDSEMPLESNAPRPGVVGSPKGSTPPRVRQLFPETWLWRDLSSGYIMITI